MSRRLVLGTVLTLPVLSVPGLVHTTAGCNRTPSQFEGEVTMHIARPGTPPSDMVFMTSGERMRFNLTAPGGKQSHAIVRPGENKMVLVMDSEKAFMEMDMGKAGAASAAMDPGGPPKVSKTGKKETVAGRSCEVWNVQHTSGKRTEACIAEGIAYFDFASTLPGAAPSSGAFAEELRQKKLFPLRSIELDATGKETSRMEVTAIQERKLEASSFEVPAGYAKLDTKKP